MTSNNEDQKDPSQPGAEEKNKKAIPPSPTGDVALTPPASDDHKNTPPPSDEERKDIRADSLVRHPRKQFKSQGANRARRNPRRNQRGGGRRGMNREQEFDEKVVDIARVTNVVKGGRRFSFSALVVIGDKKGRIAYGQGKAKEVPEAIKKAIKEAKRFFIRVPIVDQRTIPHVVQAKFVASEVLLKPAAKGRGIIASGAVRAVVELAGYNDIVTKSLGSSNKRNAVKATMKALTLLRTAKEIRELKNS